MLALAISSAAYFMGTLGKQGAAPVPNPPGNSIAVLPFQNLDLGQDSQYLSDGITEELINTLTQIPGLQVIARPSSFRFQRTALTPQAIARQLGVRYLITGSVRRHDGRLRIAAQLMEPANGFQLWSDVFDNDEKRAFAFQAQAVRRVTAALGIRHASLPRGYGAGPNAAAHNDYLMGRFFFAKKTDPGLAKALEYFTRAAAEDPRYAPIQTALADTYSVMAERGTLPPIQANQKAKAAALRALSLDDSLADTYVALGAISSTHDREFPAAEKYYLQALALNPGLVTVHQSYSYMLMKLRRFDEALLHARRAVEIDPLSNPANINLAVLLFYMRDYEGLLQRCRAMLEMDPQHAFAHLIMAQALARMGRGPAAYQELALVTDRPKDHPLSLRTHAEISATVGRPDLAELDLHGLLQAKTGTASFPSSYLAIVYASLGQKDRAFEWLEKAYAEQDGFLSLLQVYPAYDSLRSDPRYASLLRRLGFTEKTAPDSVRIP